MPFKGMMPPPNLCMAVINEEKVLVDGSKNKKAPILPFNESSPPFSTVSFFILSVF